jgi:aspartokinase
MVAGVFDALHNAAIPVQMVATGDLRMSVLLPTQHAHQAVKLIHERFDMDKELRVA